MTTINPRSIGAEAGFITTDVAELAELKGRLLAAGVTPATANGILGWLVDKATGQPDLTSSQTRSTYRKALAEHGHGPQPRRRARARGDRGAVRPRVGLAVASAAGVAQLAVTGHTAAALALVPIILEAPKSARGDEGGSCKECERLATVAQLHPANAGATANEAPGDDRELGLSAAVHVLEVGPHGDPLAKLELQVGAVSSHAGHPSTRAAA